MRRVLRYVFGVVIGLIALATGVYLFLVMRSQPMPAHPFFRLDDPLLVIAHQGGDGERPSNTMLAFQYAVDIGVDVLEMDIHSTRDGVLVTIHDATVDRTTDGTGRVNDFTLAELQALDAGYDWPTVAEESHRTDRPYRGQGVMIATLEEVLTTFPQMRMMIEIKQAEPSIAQPLCDLLRQTNMQQQVVVASFRAPALYAFRAVCPEVATSAVEDEVRTYLVLNNLGLSAAYQPSAYAFQVPEYSGDIHVVTRSFVENALPHNIVVQPWTINSEADMQRMIDLGVNGIITDYPSRLMTLLGR